MPDISIIIPCLNEEGAISLCLDEISKTIITNRLNAEIIFVDNGSKDKSMSIVKSRTKEIPNLRIFEEKIKGYGSVYLKGLSEAKGKYIVMADSDYSYDFNDIPKFISKLESGADLVVGNRFNKSMGHGVMSFHHKYIGNPLLSFLVRMIFKIKIKDIHCGIRAIKRTALEKISLNTSGMEFASEMIVKVAKQNLSIEEIPVCYRQRIGTSKLKSIGDGWRHLRFILLYSPTYLFLLPGITLFTIGVLSLLILNLTQIKIFNIQLYSHPMFISSFLIILGYQIIFFAGFSRIYAITHLGETDHFMESLFKKITIEKTGFLGLLFTLIGIIIYLMIFIKWIKSGFGSLDEINNSIIALTFVIIGIQTFFSAFMLSILGIKEKTK